METPPGQDTTERAPAERLAARMARWQERADGYARWLAPRAPLLLVALFALHGLVRILISGNLEVDEAQFVGETGFRLGGGGSHPPLYTWLVSAALWVTGGSWVVSVAVVKQALLAGHYLLAYDLLRRLKTTRMAGLAGAAALTLLPQVLWMGQLTLAHSVAVGFGTLATLHALALWLVRPRLATAVWLGLAIAIGALSKYNYLLFFVALIAALVSVRAIRMRLDHWTRWVAAATALVLTIPHYTWALIHFDVTTERVSKLYTVRGPLQAVDLPYLGIDGLLSLGLALAAWGAALVIVWAGLWRYTRPGPHAWIGRNESWDFVSQFATVCGRAAAFAIAVFAAAVFFGDMHHVHERYLTPMLLPAVIWIVVRYPLDETKSGMGPLATLATALLLAVFIAIPATVAFGPSRLAYPYAEIADDIAGTSVDPLDVIADRQDVAANIALRLPDGHIYDQHSKRDTVILWRRGGPTVPDWLAEKLPAGYVPTGAPVLHQHPYTNLSGRRVTLWSQRYTAP